MHRSEAGGPCGGVTSAMVNDLQLEVDDDGNLLFAWGLFPRAYKCQPTLEDPPASSRCRLRLVSEEAWTPGMSRRINKDRWDVFANHVTGWVCVGKVTPSEGSVAIEFAPSSIGVLEGNEIVAVWLNPRVELGSAAAKCSLPSNADGES